MSRRVAVHHFVENETTRTYGVGNRTSDLLRVNYWHDVPADTEFPRSLMRMDLFTRFYLEKAKPCEFLLAGVVAGSSARNGVGNCSFRTVSRGFPTR